MRDYLDCVNWDGKTTLSWWHHSLGLGPGLRKWRERPEYEQTPWVHLSALDCSSDYLLPHSDGLQSRVVSQTNPSLPSRLSGCLSLQQKGNYANELSQSTKWQHTIRRWEILPQSLKNNYVLTQWWEEWGNTTNISQVPSLSIWRNGNTSESMSTWG